MLRGLAAGLFQAQVAIDGDVRVDGPITLLEDWTLASQFLVAGTVNHADLPIGFTAFGQRIGTSISVRKELQGVLDSAKTTISESLNNAIRGVQIKEALKPYWYALGARAAGQQEPRSVAVHPSRRHSLLGTLVHANQPPHRLGRGGADLGFDGRKPADVSLGPLPKLTKPPQRPAFYLWLPVSVQYAELSRLLSSTWPNIRFRRWAAPRSRSRSAALVARRSAVRRAEGRRRPPQGQGVDLSAGEGFRWIPGE